MKRFTIVLAALIVLVAACSSTDDATTTSIGGSNRDPIQASTVSYGLQTFNACDDFLDYVKEHAVDMVGPWGFEYGYWGPVVRGAIEEVALDTAAADEGGAVAPAAAGENLVQGVDYSGTNIQELGVDEPDVIKTDGNRIVAVANSTLYVIDATGDEPQLTGQTAIEAGWASDMFLYGDKVLVMAYGDGYATPLIDTAIGGDATYYAPASPIANCAVGERSTALTPVRISSISGNSTIPCPTASSSPAWRFFAPAARVAAVIGPGASTPDIEIATVLTRKGIMESPPLFYPSLGGKQARDPGDRGLQIIF